MGGRARAAVAVAIGLTCVTGPATAHEYDGTTVATAAYDSAEDLWRGRVASFVDECERRRKVRLQKLDGDSWETVAKARSRRTGRWRIDMVDADGTFRVVVPARMKVTIEHDHRCDRFTSGAHEVGGR
ncbi:MAG TPA: hypothetical protein VHJ76_07220 [Actinomycetota bacterium]|nr:hypothetical protein [Actinomycetota bacterium]